MVEPARIKLCEKCGQPYGVGDWPFCDDGSGKHGHSRPMGSIGRPWHPSERTTVFRNHVTGQLSYPMRNDVPAPAPWYERIEVSNDRAMGAVEKEGGVVNEARWFDKGTGHADYMPDHKPIDLTGLEFGVKEWDG